MAATDPAPVHDPRPVFDPGPVFDLVHAQTLKYFPELVADLGGDMDAILRKSGAAATCSFGDHAGVSYRRMINLVEAAAVELDCSDFGMRLAKRQNGAAVFGPLGLAMANSRTFGEALEYVIAHNYAHSLAARVMLRAYPAKKSVFIGHDILLDRIPNKSQVVEQVMLLGHLGALGMTGGLARVRRVHFRHQPISSLRTYRRYFGCEPRFGQNEDGVVFSDQDMASPIVNPDASELNAVTAFITKHFTRHHPPLHAQVRGIVMQRLRTARCTNDRVASDLKLHPRTLHRRLQAEGTSFQQIKDEVRRDILLYYLHETDLDLMFISEKLGFTEQSVMTRSCNLWFGSSPTQVRLDWRNQKQRA